MKSSLSKPVASLPPERWPARIAHEVICVAVAAIFCGFELLLFVTEWRVKIFCGRRRAPSDIKDDP